MYDGRFFFVNLFLITINLKILIEYIVCIKRVSVTFRIYTWYKGTYEYHKL